MKVLVACEYSGRVRDAFTRRGHYAVSCDLLPTDTPGRHYRGDVRNILQKKWDLIIAHPPCTKLTTTANRWFPQWQADGSQQEAIDFFMLFANAPHKKIAIENPRGIMSSRFRKPDQYVQPWWFGDPWIKMTGLWLKGLPLLEPTNAVHPQGYWVDGGNFRVGTNRGSAAVGEGAYVEVSERGGVISNAERAHERSKTFQGIANAMAEQWG